MNLKDDLNHGNIINIHQLQLKWDGQPLTLVIQITCPVGNLKGGGFFGRRTAAVYACTRFSLLFRVHDKNMNTSTYHER